MRNECAEGSNNGTIAKDDGGRYVTGRLSYATAMAGGRRAGQKESRQPWTFSVRLRHVKGLVLDGLPFQLLQLQVNENCIYISAERQISDSHQPLSRDFAVGCLFLGPPLH